MFLIPMYPSQGWEAAHATEEEGMQNRNVPTSNATGKATLGQDVFNFSTSS